MVKKLILLADRNCSTSRAYIHYLRLNKIKIAEIWFLNFGTKSGERYKTHNFTFSKFVSYFKKKDIFIPYGLDAQLCDDLQDDLTKDGFDLFGPISTSKVAKNLYEVYANDFNDNYLENLLVENSDNTFIYTNGGIVPHTLLKKPNLKILHVHPGIVPEYKGSDCFFWSALEQNELGYSVFYMSEKIDEGEILYQQNFPITRFPRLKAYLDDLKLDTVYRSLLYSVDVHYRAITLITFIKKHDDQFSSLEPIADNDDRAPFLWMHPALLRKVIRKCFI